MIEAPWMRSKLKMPAGRPDKDIDKYIDRIYMKNKALIDVTINDINKATQDYRMGPGIGSPQAWFKHTVKDFLRESKKFTIKDAIEHIGQSSDYFSKNERSLQNISRAIRSDENFKRFRKIIGYKEIDWNQLVYKESTDTATIFVYGNIRIEAPYDSKYGHLNFYIE